MELFLAESNEEIESCFEAFQVLRPHLRDPQSFCCQVRRQEAHGYQIVAVRDGHCVASAAGFRLTEFLAWGKTVYIDDLTTLPASRGQGHAAALLDWIVNFAKTQECQSVHLDSGYTRNTAHRLYLNHGFELQHHHFVRDVR